MKKDWVLTKEAFDQLLDWLSPERSQAGKKYEAIRKRLVEIFASRRCYEAEELADETINRVTVKLPGIIADYKGDPALYFYGVAQKVYMEFLQKTRKQVDPATLPSPARPESSKELELDCLDRCIQQLPLKSRALVVDYYLEDREAQKDYRKKLAGKLNLSFNALRIRAHRVKETLHQCVKSCIERAESETNP